MKLTHLNEDKNIDYVVALDLDGVLADFDKRIKEILGGSKSEFSGNKVWRTVKHYNDTVQPFFQTLPKTPDAMELYNFVKENFRNFFVLTATGTTPNNVQEQKVKWVKDNLGSDVHVELVEKSVEKAKFATPNTILVDDRTKSINPWRAAGGIGILHKSAKESIKELEKYLD